MKERYKDMIEKDFQLAVAQGKEFMMRKYKASGEWSAPKRVSAEVAARKHKVTVSAENEFGEVDRYCPYSFELAE